MDLPKKIHVIGICGVATSALAIAFEKRGVRVTGSDKGFYPPVSTHLEAAGIPYYAGWHPEKISEGGTPDLVMVGGGGTSPNNPEAVFAREHNIPVMAYAEVLNKYFIRKNSVVVAGTWGKTTISSLLSFIMIKGGMDPAYFTGGLSLSHDTGALTDSDWSVVEGDEYQVSISDKRPKFACYAPTHLLLTSVSWDHADLYPTRDAYFKEFADLLSKLPTNGLLVSCADDAGVTETLQNSSVKCRAVTYGSSEKADYHFHSISHTKKGLDFVIDHAGASTNIHSPMLGRFNAENIAAAFAMASEIGIPADKTAAAIADFKGIKRRLEKRLEADVTILDCHAPTAEKAASVLESIRDVYKQKIIAIYEPNIGGRQRSSAHMYDGSFRDANTVIIPRLTKLKVAEGSEAPIEGDELAAIIAKTQPDVRYIDDDAKLVETVSSLAKKGDVIAFLGSHGFRGMIEEVTKVLSS